MPASEEIDHDVLRRTLERERKSRQAAEQLLEDKSRELYLAQEKLQKQYETLQMTQGQLVHSEKMASVGQLAAGVAHEINNPVGFVVPPSGGSAAGRRFRLKSLAFAIYVRMAKH